MKNFLQNLFLGIICAMFFAGTAQPAPAQDESSKEIGNRIISDAQYANAAFIDFRKPIYDEVISEVRRKEVEQNKDNPNKEFEMYTVEELREYIAKLPQTEADAEAIAFEKFALSEDASYLRALELSLYYQGWGKDVFYQFGEGHTKENQKSALDYLKKPTLKQMREGKGKIRNEQKAFLFAVLSKIINDDNGNCYFVHPTANLCYLYYEGIGTRKNQKRIQHLYTTYFVNGDELLNFESPNCTFFEYLKFYRILRDRYSSFSLADWESLYCGFLAPQKKDYVINMLTLYMDWAGEFNTSAAQILINIYSGKYSDADTDLEKKAHIQKRLNEEVERRKATHLGYIKSFHKKEILKTFKYYPDMIGWDIPNPEYDEEFATKYFFELAQRSSLKDFFVRSYGRAFRCSWSEYEKVLPLIRQANLYPKEEFENFEKDILLYIELEKKYRVP